MNTRCESGITLIEILIASAISLTIAGFLGTAIFQFFMITGHGSDVMTSMHQVENAGHWFSRDGQMASSATGGNSLVLTIPDSSDITYSLSGTNLQRTIGDAQLIVARNVTDLDFYVDDDVITMDISSSQGSSVTEHAAYKVCIRPTGGS